MDDKQLIHNLGGPSAVAKLLGYNYKTGTQRVYNWLSRGIPAKVKLDHANIFLTAATQKSN